MRNNIASRNLSSAARASMHTGNAASHNSADGPVRAADHTIRHYSHSGRDHLGRLEHPEPSNAVKQYKPGEVSRFAPQPRQPATAAPAPRNPNYIPFYINATNSRTRPYAIVTAEGKRISEHRSLPAANLALDKATRAYEAEQTLLRG